MNGQASDQFAFTAPFEGVVPHLYLDTAGLVTGGVGFMFPELADAQRLPWEPSRALELDWAIVRTLAPGRAPDFYRRQTTARLPEPAMRAEFARRLAAFEAQVMRSLPAWRTYPEPARIALLDMAYNLGGNFLVKWPHLQTAALSRDWARCAAESHRNGIQAARNDATRALFQKCV